MLRALPNPNPPAIKIKPAWRFARRLSARDIFKAKKGFCRYCHKKVSGKRINWCSDECVVAALILCGDVGEIKRCLLKRDKGICAKCGVDTLKLRKEVLARKKSGKKAASVPPGRNRYWDIEHKIPVVEGGGFCTLDNFETLCIPCHKKSTAALAARRAEARHD